VPPAATGEWAGREEQLAAWQDETWSFHTPRDGWIAYALDENKILAIRDGEWTIASFDAAIPERLGVNVTASAPNRIAVAGDACLFTREGAGHQIKINKATPVDTASILLQTGFSARVEIGIIDNDDLRFKGPSSL
jgi:hypothetical protein